MSTKAVWVRADDLYSLVEIPLSVEKVAGVRRILKLLGVPEVGPEGGHGFIIGDGAVSISGTKSACEKAVNAVLTKLNGPRWLTGDEIYARQKQGAMP